MGSHRSKNFLQVHMLQSLIDSEVASPKLVQSIVGKILHVHVLIRNGRFHLLHLLKANVTAANSDQAFQLPALAKGQAWFWLSLLRTCSGRAGIPSPYRSTPPWAVNVYTDAAGGSPHTAGLGCGAVTADWWLFLPWSRAINNGRPTADGRSLDRCMSALELVGPLAAVCARPDAFRGRPATFWVDNAGSVFIWQKGYSMSCALSSTLVSALAVAHEEISLAVKTARDLGEGLLQRMVHKYARRGKIAGAAFSLSRVTSSGRGKILLAIL